MPSAPDGLTPVARFALEIIGVVSLVALLGACLHARRGPERRVARGVSLDFAAARSWGDGVDVRSYSEIEPISAVAELSGRIYVASGAQVWRFDPLARRMPHPSGDAGGRVTGLAAHPVQGLWAATEEGLVARMEADGWVVVATPGVGAVRTLVAAAEGVWVGGDAGVARWSGGAWARAELKVAPTALRAQSGGRLWIGTANGLYLWDGAKVAAHDKGQGQLLRRVDQITTTQAGAVLAVGRDERGGAVLGYFDGRHWTSYRAPGPLPFACIGRLRQEIFVCSAGKMLSLIQLSGLARQAPPARAIVLTAQPSPRAPSGYPSPEFALAPLPLRLPTPTAVSDAGHELLVGTKDLGVARVSPRDLRWLRPGTLARGERRLKMGCVAGRCYLALRGRAVVHSDEHGFRQRDLPGLAASKYVHAFLPGPGGKLWVLHGAARTNLLVLSELEGGRLRQLHQLAVGSAERALRVRFARFSPRGDLWVGLAVLSDEGRQQPWGVAVLRHGELIAHHRAGGLGEPRGAADLGLPNDVRDVTFGDAGVVWLATAAGVCRLDGRRLTIYTENDGLESEVSYSIGWSPAGEVVVGTLRGVGRFDGAYWRFDLGSGFHRTTRALLSEGARLWAGTSAGLARLSAGKIEVLSRADGLIADGVLDLFRAPNGSLWALTEDGLSIIRQP